MKFFGTNIQSIFPAFLLAGSLAVSAQTAEISGTLRDRQTTESLPFGTVFVSGTGIGTTADEHGFFRLNLPESVKNRWLSASFLGYATDSLAIAGNRSTFNFSLSPAAGSLGEVVISGTMKETSTLESPILVEVFNPVFFKKNPTPSIFEALTMVNGVQPQLNCNVCNTGDIHINGMEGPYTMVLIDGMPIVSALSTVYGLAGIPNSMVKRIEIVKGPASTLYGSEAVGGLINIITKDPLTAPRLQTDISTTDWLDWNADLTTKFSVGKAVGLLGVNGFRFQKIHDRNADGFTDVPLQTRLSIFNKWDFERKTGRPASVAARFVHENRWGGQTGFAPEWRGTDHIYGESIETRRVEFIGAYGLPQRIGFQYSYNFHFQDSYYGTTKFLATQHTAFGQFRWDKTLPGGHSLLVGLPFRFVFYDDNSPATASSDLENRPQRTILPGIFLQDEWAVRKNLTTLLGIRYDHHDEHGHIFTPRLSFKQKIGARRTLRLSFGNGYRVVNLFTEDHAALTGARQVVITERLRPERSWNGNLNFSTQTNHRAGFIGLDASLFYTRFTNKITGDFAADPQKIIYDNLHGRAISKGFTLNSDFSFTSGLKIMVGATAMDVFQIEKNMAGDHLKTSQLFAPKLSVTSSASYTWSRYGLGFDLTAQLKSPMHLPVVPHDFRPEMSPWFALVNLQLTKKWGHAEVYGGVKNLLNFVPRDPILRPFDPFNKQIGVDNPHGYTFDPSYNYAPLQGIRAFTGMRWTLF